MRVRWSTWSTLLFARSNRWYPWEIIILAYTYVYVYTLLLIFIFIFFGGWVLPIITILLVRWPRTSGAIWMAHGVLVPIAIHTTGRCSFFRTPSDRFNWIKMRNAPLQRIAGVSGSKPQCGRGTWCTYPCVRVYVYRGIKYAYFTFLLLYFFLFFFLFGNAFFRILPPKSA